MAVRFTRREHSASELRAEAARTRDGAMARRLLALALVLEGSSRTQAAEACGMDRQTLRDWVHRYNAEGIAGLANRPRLGRKSRLSGTQEARIAALVREGPDLHCHGVVRWRRIDLCKVIQEEFGVTYHERSVGKVLRRLGFRRLSARPRHPAANVEAQAAFKKTSPAW